MNLEDAQISAVLADVDGTLVTKDKVLTPRALHAVDELRERGIVFTITSGRPPFGMKMLVAPLGLAVPMAAFNGGVILLPDQSILDERPLPEYLVPALIDMIESHGLDIFVFRSHDWFVRSLNAPRVARETSTIQQAPIVVPKFDDVLTGVVKIVGVGNDHARVATCEAAVQHAFGDLVSAARSQPHYLDITHPQANKGVVIERLSRYLSIPLEHIAALGDQPNDVAMFERAGISIAMGNASDEVKRSATLVTSSYADEGFANAVEQFILPHAAPAGGPGVRPTAWLHRVGQSVWLDEITRGALRAGALRRCVDELSVTGLVSNPATLAADVPADDPALAALVREGRFGEDLVFDLALDDLREAADLLLPIHEHSAGLDGWVSLAIPPFPADDPSGALAVLRARLSRAGRPNFMVQVPGTHAYLPVIEEAIAAGLPIDVTLVFSREQYLAAAEAFLRGIERRIEAGMRPDVGSLASISVADWDAAVAGRVTDTRLGIAMAQRTYKAYRGLLHSPRWQRIYDAGARPQRLRWAHTGIADPHDLTYVEALTAQFTVLAMLEPTLNAFASHGEIASLMHADAEDTLVAFTGAGIDLYALAAQLQNEAARSLVASWNRVGALVASKLSAKRDSRPSSQR